ncbi:MAG: hypothetical protein ACXWRE_12805 [Pseudobdellovibrionaceae bacterium]
MGNKRIKAALSMALMLTSLKVWSSEGMESDPALSSALNNTMNTMNQQKATLAVETEVTNLDNEEYQAAEKQTVSEINKLNGEIKDLERQQRSLDQEADRAKNKAELASKRLQLKKAQQTEAQNRVKQATTQKRRADHQLSQVKATLDLTEQQLAQAKQRTHEIQESLRAIDKDNKKLKSKVDQMKKMIAQEKKRKDGLRSKRVRLTEEGQRLRTQIHNLEKST